MCVVVLSSAAKLCCGTAACRGISVSDHDDSGSAVPDVCAHHVRELGIPGVQDDLEAEKIAAAERARRAEASSRALREQQAQAGAALASVQKHMQDMPSKSAVDPRKTEEELTRLCKQVRSKRMCFSLLEHFATCLEGSMLILVLHRKPSGTQLLFASWCTSSTLCTMFDYLLCVTGGAP